MTTPANELALFGRQVVQVRSLNGGKQAIFRFDNGFGASVVQHFGSYGSEQGLWELAVPKWTGDEWHLTYDTDITEDVIGHLFPSDVDELLTRIMALDSEGQEPKDPKATETASLALTPADELRQAAATIREVAAKATPGPWWADGWEIYTQDRDWVAESLDVDNQELAASNGEHIAMWHPGIALPIAVMLEHWAVVFDRIEAQNQRPGDGRTRIIGLNTLEQGALDLARLINGSGAK